MNKLEGLKALIGMASPGPFKVINDNESSEYLPLWMVENEAMSSEDGDRPMQLVLHFGVKEDLDLFVVMRNYLPQLVAIAEFALKVSRQTPEKPDHWSSCGQCDWNSNKFEELITELTKDADK